MFSLVWLTNFNIWGGKNSGMKFFQIPPWFAEFTGELLLATQVGLTKVHGHYFWNCYSFWWEFSKFIPSLVQKNRNLIPFCYNKLKSFTKIQVSKRERKAQATRAQNFVEKIGGVHSRIQSYLTLPHVVWGWFCWVLMKLSWVAKYPMFFGWE